MNLYIICITKSEKTNLGSFTNNNIKDATKIVRYIANKTPRAGVKVPAVL